MRYKVISLLLILLLITITSCNKKNIVTKQEAENIAKEFVTETFNGEYLDLPIEIEERDHIWVVTYFDQSAEFVLDGGGPVVVIRKDSGKIVSCTVGSREYVLGQRTIE